MIFVTVGAQMPFDRLVRAMDEWAFAQGRDDVFAQVGQSEYRPRNMAWVPFLSPMEFRSCARRADLLVAHAGTGTIITALQYRVPLLMMPRRSALAETRNDHQIATVRRFSNRPGITVADDERDLIVHLQQFFIHGSVNGSPAPLAATASPELIKTLRKYING